MKTKTSLFPGIKNMITLLIATTSVINATAQVYPQKSKVGIDNLSVMASVSGNGFGLHYSPMVGIGLTEKVVVSAGPVFRTDKPYFAGYVVSGKLMLLDPEDSFSNKTGLYAFMSFEKNHKQYFSKNWIEMEELTSMHTSFKEFEFDKVRFSGFEITTGFAVGYSVTKNFSLNTEFGLSVYKTTRLNYDEVRLYHQPVGFVLHLSMTARLNINRN